MMASKVAPSTSRRRKHRISSFDLFCLMVIVSNSSQVVESDLLQGLLDAPVERNPSVFKSTLSSLQVETAVAQVVSGTSQDDGTSYSSDRASSLLDAQPRQRKRPVIREIRDHSNGLPALHELVQKQRLRFHRHDPHHHRQYYREQQQQRRQQQPVSPAAVARGAELAPVQLLRARSAGDVQPVSQASGAGAMNERRHGRMSRSIQVRAQLDTSQASQAASEAKGLKSVLRGTKKLLSSGFSSIEQRAGGLLWLSSNLLAALIPLASLLGLPSFASGGANASQSAPMNQTRRRGSLAERVTSSLASLPDGQQLVSALSGSGNAGIQSRVEYVMGWLERSVEHLPNFPRLHPQECVKRSICEAHHEPGKYGLVGLTLRLLFPASPATANGTEANSPMDNMEYKVINKYRHAAGYGMSRRLDSNSAGEPVCKEKYDDCLVSLLEVGQKLIDFFLR